MNNLSPDIAIPKAGDNTTEREAAVKSGRLRTTNGETEALPADPHWIVLCLSKQREAPAEYGFRIHFRHATSGQAIAQAQRLAAKEPGRRFSVYGSGPSFKIERTAKET